MSSNRIQGWEGIRQGKFSHSAMFNRTRQLRQGIIDERGRFPSATDRKRKRKESDEQPVEEEHLLPVHPAAANNFLLKEGDKMSVCEPDETENLDEEERTADRGRRPGKEPMEEKDKLDPRDQFRGKKGYRA
ncbi:SCAR-like protein 2 [Striga asiatica]|uniref:SCAR-like protein 2 n=1 Tax=Striga asiatica TaxID=4170 RepID=A0A5A7R324_STRAF|nr:SCAR-like protein 2 [Striga asiatica]